MPDFSFRLLPDFIEKYKRHRTTVRFRDAGGNSLGEITFIRTYPALKTTAPKRSIGGLANGYQRHVHDPVPDWAKNKITLNDNKGQTSASCPHLKNV